jgi:hypothetical protein
MTCAVNFKINHRLLFYYFPFSAFLNRFTSNFSSNFGAMNLSRIATCAEKPGATRKSVFPVYKRVVKINVSFKVSVFSDLIKKTHLDQLGAKYFSRPLQDQRHS